MGVDTALLVLFDDVHEGDHNAVEYVVVAGGHGDSLVAAHNLEVRHALLFVARCVHWLSVDQGCDVLLDISIGYSLRNHVLELRVVLVTVEVRWVLKGSRAEVHKAREDGCDNLAVGRKQVGSAAIESHVRHKLGLIRRHDEAVIVARWIIDKLRKSINNVSLESRVLNRGLLNVFKDRLQIVMVLHSIDRLGNHLLILISHDSLSEARPVLDADLFSDELHEVVDRHNFVALVRDAEHLQDGVDHDTSVNLFVGTKVKLFWHERYAELACHIDETIKRVDVLVEQPGGHFAQQVVARITQANLDLILAHVACVL